jgi:hypothetical protein
MKIAATILNLKMSERTEIEEKGGNRTKVLLFFMAKARKYANQDQKVLHLATDDLTTYSEFKQNYPAWNVDVIESEGEPTSSAESASSSQ